MRLTKIIFTMPNSDAGGRLISQYIDQFVQRHSGQAVSFQSMGQIRYLSALREVDVVIGNSSSGIIEAPYFKTLTVNIGKRRDIMGIIGRNRERRYTLRDE